MKVLFVLLALTIAVMAQPFPCTSPIFDSACVDTGVNCTTTAIAITGGFYVRNCAPEDECVKEDVNEEYGTCTTILDGPCGAVGCSPIFRTSQFVDCNAGTSTCEIAVASRSAGDDCTDTTECLGAMQCTNNVCVGLVLDDDCTTGQIGDRECAYGLYCTAAGKCAAQNATGETCAEDKECLGFGLCRTTDNTCVVPYSLTDAPCSSSQQCVGTQFCNSGMCVNAFATGTIDCMDNSECTAPEFCTCVSDEMKCFGATENPAASCITVFDAYRNCLAASQCKVGVENAERMGSCSQKNCYQEFACASTCLNPGCPPENAVALEAVCNPPASSSTQVDGADGVDGVDGVDGADGSTTTTGTVADGTDSAATVASNWLM